MNDLILTETDLTNARAGIADGENRYGMSLAAIALGAARAMPDDSLEQRAAEDVLCPGEARGEANRVYEGWLIDSLLLVEHYNETM